MLVPILAAKYTDYILLGYGLSVLILGVVIGSIWWRYRSLAQDEALLARLEREELDAPVSAETPTQHPSTPESQSVKTPQVL